MAEEYGFEYEFVTYKWPHWLRAQTEKQRIIWAYVWLPSPYVSMLSTDTRSSSWMSCSRWTSTRSSSLMPVSEAGKL